MNNNTSNTNANLQQQSKPSFSDKLGNSFLKANAYLKKHKVYERFWKGVGKAIYWLGKVMGASIIWLFLTGLVPELREQLPHFYQFMDMLAKMTDELFKFVMNSIGSIF